MKREQVKSKIKNSTTNFVRLRSAVSRFTTRIFQEKKLIKKIDHIGIAVKDLDQQVKFYTQVFGLSCSGIEEVADQKVKVAIFPVGEVRIELLQPTAEDSPIAKFIEKKGEGIHHIAYLVSDLAGNLKQLEQREVKLIDSQPKIGAGGHKIAFIHPKATFGVLTELCEH